MPSFSIAICTHNRADPLEQALSSICMAKPPTSSDFEVVVVLNKCIDESAAVVGHFENRLPVVLATEERLGLSHARNRAVEICSGDFIVFVDDDVCVDPLFLVAYETAFRRFPEADIFSGPILPDFEGGPPAWLKRALPVVGSAFALQRVERDGAPIGRSSVPYGCNYAIRSTVQKKRSYDPELGRGDVAWLRNGEETVLLEAMLASGCTGRWVSGALLYHMIPPDRQTVEYLWRYYEGYGTLLGIQEAKGLLRPRSIVSAAVELASAEVTYRVARVAAPPDRWARALVRAAVRRGRWKGFRIENRESGKRSSHESR